MNKFSATLFVATFAILGLSFADAKTEAESRILFNPSQWVPLPNVPVPKPPTGGSGSTANTCPPLSFGCTKCGSTKPDKCDTADGGTQAYCSKDACPAACAPACVNCITGCTV